MQFTICNRRCAGNKHKPAPTHDVSALALANARGGRFDGVGQTYERHASLWFRYRAVYHVDSDSDEALPGAAARDECDTRRPLFSSIDGGSTLGYQHENTGTKTNTHTKQNKAKSKKQVNNKVTGA